MRRGCRIFVHMALPLILIGCGDDNQSGVPPIIVPTPLPTPTPSPTPTPTPAPVPIAVQKLRAAMAFGSARQVSGLAVTVTHSSSSAFIAGSFVQPDDPKIRLLGGRAIRGGNFPQTTTVNGQAVTNGDPSILNAQGLALNRYSINNGFEFNLPANQTDFEIRMFRNGPNLPLQLEIDGIAAAADGFDNGWNVGAGFIFSRFELPASAVPRRITIWTGGRSFGGLNLPTGQSIGAAPERPRPFNMVFQGDSITGGAVSTHPVFGWPMQAAYRLGIDNPIVVGVGGSGYLARLPTTTGYNFRERLDDVVKAVDGGPPDAVVIGGGINDCSVSPVGAPFTASAVGTEALAYFQTLRTNAPNMLIIVLGPFTDWNNPDYNDHLRACRDAIFGAANQVGGTYTIDVSNWVTSSNRAQVFDGGSNGPHPINSGHAIYGDRAASAIRALFQGT